MKANRRRRYSTWCALTVALSCFASVGNCISIDSQLTVIKSDCYERLAIGQKIVEKNVSRKKLSKTFADCQLECTEEKDNCKSFSFGVGVKGNSTCELSSNQIKETTSKNLDGTVDDTDYDLYVKKRDCKFLGIPHEVVSIESTLPVENIYTTEELPEGYPRITTSHIPLPFNADYKPKRRPGTYKKQHDYPLMEHRLQMNRKQDYGISDESNLDDDGYIGAISYNRYDKPEQINNKKNDGDYKNKIPYDYIGSNGPPRGYGYSNLPEDKPKPIPLDDQNDYGLNTYNYNKNKHPFRPNYLQRPYQKPTDYDTPEISTSNSPYIYDKPTSSFGSTFQDPDNPNYPAHSQKPLYQYDKPSSQFGLSGYPMKRPQENFEDHSTYELSIPRPYLPNVRPVMEDTFDYGSNPKRPNFGFLAGVYELHNGEYKPYGSGNSIGNVYSPRYPHQKPFLDEEYRPQGVITSHLTEIRDVCFKRILAGKRVSRAFVRKIVSCERVEECQQECTEERKFVCEGFNYRLDPSGRGKGDCELVDLPFVLLDHQKDIITNPNYDYYEKDRNSYPRCKEMDGGFRPSSGGLQHDSSYGGGYRDTHRYESYPPRSPPRPGFVFKLPPPDDGFRPYNNRRNDHDPYYFNKGGTYLPIKPELPPPKGYNRNTHVYPNFAKEYEQKTYLPPHNTLDYNTRKNLWNQYGYDYDNYGKGKPHHAVIHYDGGAKHGLPPIQNNYVPLPFDGDYSKNNHYLPPTLPTNIHQPYEHTPYINECSLRSASGYKLYNKVVKKILTVGTIYECEMACFKEIDFICTSYAFRYIVGSGIPPNNCYLSDRNYKELDYYTDLEQDRNFDIYTMHNKERCVGYVPHQKELSECFLHVRSGQRLHDTCVRDSIFVKSFIDCQLECLRSNRFLCRSFAFRYGSPIIGGIAENCQLSDIQFRELDPFKDLIPDPGFVLYERESYGYGCELDRINEQYLPSKRPTITSEADKICYLGYGWPARLLPGAIRKSVKLSSEEECRAECTRLRMKTPFCCMSFSYRAVPIHGEPNCFLSDVFQRDLLETVDFVKDPDFWLFSWDNFNTQCRFPDYYEQRVPFEDKYDVALGTITWRIYSVGGWPCKRGSLCKQSALGFWFCELEGGSPSSWDYCCRPGHQCGFSEGYSYQWCFVGPSLTQWRKCNDKYYPYLPAPHFRIPSPPKPSTTYLPPSTSILIDHETGTPTITTGVFQTFPPPASTDPNVPNPTIFFEEPKKTYLPPSHRQPRPWQTTGKPLLSDLRPPYRQGFRPDRPEAPPPDLVPKPSLNEYESNFNNFFLDPPKPGGFGQARHWPVSYLHRESPPNATASVNYPYEQMREGKESKLEPKFEAIKNLIEVIKSNDLDNIKYQITNDSNKPDDVLHVQIPLPSNFSQVLEEKKGLSDKLDNEGLLPPKVKEKIVDRTELKNRSQSSIKQIKNLPVYRRSYIVKTNATEATRWKFPGTGFTPIT